MGSTRSPTFGGFLRRRNGPAGFTLIELLVVLLLISLIGAVVGVRAGGGLSGLALKEAAKKTAATLRYARSQSAWEGVPYVVRFSFEERTFELFAERPEDEAAEEAEPSGPEEGARPDSRVYPLPEGVRVEKVIFEGDERNEGVFAIVFSPTGGCTGGEFVFINEREARMHVSVDFITGAVSLSQGTE